MASAFGVNPGTVWRWKTAFTDQGVLGLATERPGPRGPSKLSEVMRARIVELDATGSTLMSIAEQTGVSTARVALGRVVTPRRHEPVDPVEPAQHVEPVSKTAELADEEFGVDNTVCGGDEFGEDGPCGGWRRR